MVTRFSCEPLRTVIFDGECGFCLHAIQLGKRLDWGHRMEWRARLEPGLLEQFPQLSHEGTQRRMVSIRPDGTTYGGFFAVRDIMRHLPLTALPALLLFLPGVSRVGVVLYQWVASHRYRFGGTGDDHCPVENRGQPEPPNDVCSRFTVEGSRERPVWSLEHRE